MLSTINHATLHQVLQGLHQVEDLWLPQLDRIVCDLAHQHGERAPELIEAQEHGDILEASVRLHMDEDATFALPLIQRLARGEQVDEAELDALPRVMTMLSKRFDRLQSHAAVIRELLIHAALPDSAEGQRETALDVLDEIVLACARHDQAERGELFGQASAAVHQQLVANSPDERG